MPSFLVASVLHAIPHKHIRQLRASLSRGRWDWRRSTNFTAGQIGRGCASPRQVLILDAIPSGHCLARMQRMLLGQEGQPRLRPRWCCTGARSAASPGQRSGARAAGGGLRSGRGLQCCGRHGAVLPSGFKSCSAVDGMVRGCIWGACKYAAPWTSRSAAAVVMMRQQCRLSRCD